MIDKPEKQAPIISGRVNCNHSLVVYLCAAGLSALQVYHHPATLYLTCSNSAIRIHVQTRYQITTRLSPVLGGPTAPMGRLEREAQCCPMTAVLVLTHSAYAPLLSCVWANSDLSQCGSCISRRITSGLCLSSGRALCPFADQDRVSQPPPTPYYLVFITSQRGKSGPPFEPA